MLRTSRRGAPRRRLATSAWAALIVALTSVFAAAQTQSYYPHAPGLSWTYSSGETQTLSGPRTMNGREVMVLTHYYEGIPISEDYLEYRADGVLSHGTAAGGQVFGYEPGLVVYPAEPLAPGATWTSTSRMAGFNVTLSAEVVGLRGVATTVGRYNALLIRQTTLTSNGARTLLDIYFVPTVGIVRFVTQDGTTIDLIDKNF